MAGDSRKYPGWPKMAGDSLGRLGIAGNAQKLPKRAGDDRKCPGMAGNVWGWLVMAGNMAGIALIPDGLFAR